MRTTLLVIVVIALSVFEFMRGGFYEMTMTLLGAGLGLGADLWLRKNGWLKIPPSPRTPERAPVPVAGTADHVAVILPFPTVSEPCNANVSWRPASSS